MFKLLILKELYNLSYEDLEFQVSDRLSWMNFLGLNLATDIPDSTTVRLFFESVKEHGLSEQLFDKFWEQINSEGFSMTKGRIIDSSFVESERRHTTKEETKQLKEGIVPQTLTDNPNRLAQTDIEANWTKKGDDDHFGYKNHITVDAETKFIETFGVTPASVHDVKLFTEIVPENSEYPNEPYYADAGYVGEDYAEKLRKRGYDPQVCERLPKSRPLLIDEVKDNNRTKSKVRCRVEHVFGSMKMRVGDETHRLIGMARAVTSIGLKNLVYNMTRFVTLTSAKSTKSRIK
jgi:IS5 family transposase